ncbi:hypothetical protein HOC01_01545 [archaeon]|jgi:hypothetical protein|nr:hypothetical protein [archaeon]MBT6697997.1 hypothetical protein [archaeon]
MVDIIKTYKQTRPMSCGPSCALMVAEHFSPGLIPFTMIEEHTIIIL